jgi:hypothetical protein
VKYDAASFLEADMDFETWRKDINAKVAGIDEAIEVLMRLRNSYLLASYPHCLKKSAGADSVSPAKIRRVANAPWDDKSGY